MTVLPLYLGQVIVVEDENGNVVRETMKDTGGCFLVWDTGASCFEGAFCSFCWGCVA